ncbi:MAG: hypothetical protein H7175_05775 [Burkholderiales bacterium]|nr:hypothetical protein [Anaerolineae bacterium]
MTDYQRRLAAALALHFNAEPPNAIAPNGMKGDIKHLSPMHFLRCARTFVHTPLLIGKPLMRTFVLHDRVYCARCIAGKPHGLNDDNYGRMHPYFQNQNGITYYRCIAQERGYEKCGQRGVHSDVLDEQIVEILSEMVIPEDFRERIEFEVRRRLENAASLGRMEEIGKIVERIDLSWEQSFIDKEAYVEKRRQLQQEIEALRPIDYDELTEATDLIQNFRIYWNECTNLDNPEDARKQLIAKVVDRVFVYGGKNWRLYSTVISQSYLGKTK